MHFRVSAVPFHRPKEIKATEDLKLSVMEEKHKQDMKAIREEMNHQFGQIMLMIQQNPGLAHIKSDVLSKKIRVADMS